MPAPLAAIGAKAIGSGFAKEAGKQIVAGGVRRSMSGGDDMVSFAGRGGIGDPSDKKQGQVMSDQLAGEVATEGIGMLGPKGMVAAKIIETVPGGKEMVGKVVNGAISNSPAMKAVENLGAFRAGKEAKADIGGMKGPSMGLPGLTPPKLV